VEAWKVRFWNQRIVTAGDQGKIFVYDPNTGELKNDYRFNDSFITGIAINGKNEIVFSNSMGEIGIFIKQGVVPIPTDHRKYIRAITFASDGNRIITCSDDLRISVIDL